MKHQLPGRYRGLGLRPSAPVGHDGTRAPAVARAQPDKADDGGRPPENDGLRQYLTLTHAITHYHLFLGNDTPSQSLFVNQRKTRGPYEKDESLILYKRLKICELPNLSGDPIFALFWQSLVKECTVAPPYACPPCLPLALNGLRCPRHKVCVHVLPSLDGLEIVQIHPKTGAVAQAGCIALEIDSTLRTLKTPKTLATTLRTLYLKNQIPLELPTSLIVPGFYTRTTTLPTDLTETELQTALVSEAEQFFLFRHHDPCVDWLRTPDGGLIYSAYPAPFLDAFVHAFAQNETPLTGVDLNYFAIARGLVATGIMDATQEPLNPAQPAMGFTRGDGYGVCLRGLQRHDPDTAP